MTLDLQAPAFAAKREALRSRSDASRAAFEEQRLALEAERALSTETDEVMSPEAFVARLADLSDPFDAVRGKQDGEKADHQN